jgi:hypothetical protein
MCAEDFIWMIELGTRGGLQGKLQYEEIHNLTLCLIFGGS